MTKISFQTIKEANYTRDGKIFPRTVYCLMDQLPKCANCGDQIREEENCWFCDLAKKFFCWECAERDRVICSKFYGVFQNHSDILIKPKIIKEVAQ